ncbi:hypothetical protein QMA71_22820 [Pseudomonas otitidis]|jgi:hypothetical protein|uniref:hypothetical protein n=1 Tax=Pseudomonadaceae TaxID=135621 RepID=UPI0023FA3183|nr:MULTISPECIES: hypothetical protein [Pseudomonas]MBU3055778.1 hypothetical protein [Pseudomonas indica]MDI6528378.1 hypothetical protein [Pseudomonas otitidis]
MKDSWCSSVWDGKQWLSGAAAREYRLSLAGGVDSVVRRASENAVREALAEVNGVIREANRSKSNVVPLTHRRSRKVA